MMELMPTLKSLHVHAVVLGGALFSLRGLLVHWRQNPFAQPWLVAKLMWLIAYIGLGSFAL